jgi:hypothetical protein
MQKELLEECLAEGMSLEAIGKANGAGLKQPCGGAIS